MRKSRFAEEQRVAIVRGAARTSVDEPAKKNPISERRICAWRSDLGAMDPVDVKRLGSLASENARLTKLLAVQPRCSRCARGQPLD